MPRYIPTPGALRAASAADNWRDANGRGLALARAGNWQAAATEFESAGTAIEVLARDGAISAEVRDEARAVLLSNLAQSQYRSGRYHDAARSAARVCGLRVGLYGESSLSVARARCDLAVILGADGHVDEALSLLDRAMDTVEKKLGNESRHLLPLLCNSAQMLLSANRVPMAAPYVARLRSLLSAIGESTESADRMMAFITQTERELQQSARATSRAGEVAATAIPAAATPTPPSTFDIGDSAAEGDDLMLRDAIALTGDLLRSTPTSNTPVHPRRETPIAESALVLDSLPPIALVYEAAEEQSKDEAVPDVELGERGALLIDVLDLEEARIQPPAVVTQANAERPDEVLDGVAFDLVEPPPPTLNALPRNAAVTNRANPLGFDVEYGIPIEDHAPLGEITLESGSEATTEQPLNAVTEQSLNAVTAEPPNATTAEPPNATTAEPPNATTAEPPIATTARINPEAKALATESIAKLPDDPPRRPIRAVGGIRSGRTQVAEPGRLMWYVYAAVIAGGFAAGVAAKLWLLPLLR